MTCRVPVVLAVAVMSFAATAGVARADPAPSACNYTLSPPHVVQLSGTDVVTATLSPAGCHEANSQISVACVQVQGSDGPGKCVQNNGPLTAQVYFAPYRPGATYVSTGSGCATRGNPPQPSCQTTGPYAATL
ncbi:MAG TPA: hypothetical protein VHI10_18505 [Mycobacterium sp.]|nr:hypothetical protein [Mycobacterium sp.]